MREVHIDVISVIRVTGGGQMQILDLSIGLLTGLFWGKMQYSFPKMRGGQRSFGTSQNSSILVP